jgi:ParB family transcriptional regulator, chromosome partitioning protein
MSTQKRSVLGRGLSALIPKSPAKEVSILPGVVREDSGGIGLIASVDVEKIHPNPFQPRSDFDKASLEDLSRSILEKGVIQPVTVRRINGEYQLISGERRLRAAQHAGLARIPAYVIEVQDEGELLELALIENIQRDELNAIEIAHAYRRLVDERSLTQDEVAQKVGKDRTTVSNFLRLLRLPEKIKDGLRRGLISMGHARALIAVPDERLQLRLYKRIVESGLSVRKIEELTKGTPPTRKRSKHSASSEFQSIEERLRIALGTKVKVRGKKGGGGEIVVEYYNLDDLDRLLDLLASRQDR